MEDDQSMKTVGYSPNYIHETCTTFNDFRFFLHVSSHRAHDSLHPPHSTTVTPQTQHGENKHTT